MDTTTRRKIKQQKGFAVMDKSKQREIASKGGKAAHEKGTAHEWTSQTAGEAGKKGGGLSRGGRGRLRDETQEPGRATPEGS